MEIKYNKLLFFFLLISTDNKNFDKNLNTNGVSHASKIEREKKRTHTHKMAALDDNGQTQED